MNILMIVFNYPPLNNMGTSRLYSFAKYWTQMGCKVTVVTPKKYSYHGVLNYIPKDKEIGDIELFEVEFATWFTKKFDNKSLKDTNTEKASFNIIRKVVRFLRKNFIGNAFDTQKLWENEVYKKAENLVTKRDFDFVFSSFSPPVTHAIASKLKNKYQDLFWVADYRDLWSGNHLLKTGKVLKIFEEKKERKLLQHADLMVTASDGFREYLEKFHKRKVHTIFNGYDHDEIKSISKKRFFSDDGKIRFVYTGTIYIGTRDPSPFFKALKRCEEEGLVSFEKLEIWFFGDSANVLQLAKKEGVSSYINIGGYISKQDAYRAQRDASGLLFLEKQANEFKLSSIGTIPAKVYESIISTTEIFAIGVNHSSFVGKLIEDSFAGYTYNEDVDKIYYRLKEMLSSKQIEKLNVDKKIIEQYRRDKNAKKLISLVKENKY